MIPLRRWNVKAFELSWKKEKENKVIHNRKHDENIKFEQKGKKTIDNELAERIMKTELVVSIEQIRKLLSVLYDRLALC